MSVLTDSIKLFYLLHQKRGATKKKAMPVASYTYDTSCSQNPHLLARPLKARLIGTEKEEEKAKKIKRRNDSVVVFIFFDEAFT